MGHRIESIALFVCLATAGVSISLPTRADEAAPSDWLPNAPVESAVILDKGPKTRLALVNLVTATYEELDARPDAGNPVWSPDGSQLVYRAGKSLYRVRPHGEPPTRIHDSLPAPDQATGVYVFSPDGRRLAVATKQGLVILDSAGAKEVARNTPGFQLSYLTWSADGQRLAACRWNRLTGTAARESVVLFRLDPNAVPGRPIQRQVDGCALLGKRNDAWLVKTRRPDLSEEVRAVADDGHITQRWRMPSESFAQSYFKTPDALLVAAGVEDEGDPSRLILMPLSKDKSRPWLRKFRRVSDIGTDQSGSFVMLVDSAPRKPQTGRTDLVLTNIDETWTRRVVPVERAEEHEHRHELRHGQTHSEDRPTVSSPTPRPIQRAQP